MKMEKLPRMLIDYIYRENVSWDFHPSEVKPYHKMIASIEAGDYQCYGFFEKDEMMGYAFFLEDGKNKILYLDYMAVLGFFRGKGQGNPMLQIIYDTFAADYSFLLAEVEDPKCAEDANARYVRQGRASCYTKNDFYVSGVRSIVSGHQYEILVLPLQRYPDDHRVADCMSRIYQKVYEEEFYHTQIEINFRNGDLYA